MTDTILTNATLVLPDEVIRGTLVMRGETIAEISETPSTAPGAIDCAGDLVIPGLIELHTDNLERHLQPRPKVDWPHTAAIIAHDAELCSVGITTVFDALRVGSVVKDAADYKEYARHVATEILDLRAKDALRISHFLHLRAECCSETLVQELDKFGEDDRVGIVSLMDHTPGERQFRDLSKLKAYVCGKHNLSDDQFDDHVAAQIALKERFGAVHEAAAVAACARFGAVLASHDDTTADHVAVSAQHGVSFAEFPTTVEAAQACRDHGIKVMMGAPNLIRGGSHSGNVAAHHLAELDLLDIVSSDYVPASLLSSALLLGDLWGDVARGVRTVTAAPAEATGLHDRGRLTVGKRADILRIKRIEGTATVHGVWVKGQRAG
ncbi:alpha-D-ribose 1-methylphosphonate 5-triphosphate diphosphatase [Donghicola sp. C2-DW-16]|uniref:Alpha-D-ribose 1-methylphosphonate 5-triphosphate diphosphatase n=1 Tax=Donghicola mangrovi TaxID=2729614 RepID=A0ABX2PE16_9RHOB|nr:alpha-D-ribose 1-methylphosphonate 5-triphosphate diphosphatase [Donghicola mangrovi]NVO27262.1 alpha-D-ribose 1-methylphosphonate 5-triphosphate diphosphatase [Donghicola mangrovi]